MADVTLAEVIELVRASPIDFTGPPARVREDFEALFAEAPRPDSVRYEAAEVGGIAGLWARVGESAGDRAIVYVHGGGFIVGSAAAYAALGGSLAHSAGVDTFIVDYRLAPEQPYPAAPRDVLKVYRSMLSAGMKSVAVAGDSAGGALVMSLLLQARQEGLRMPACAVLWSPWLNFACDTASYRRNAARDPTLTTPGLLAGARHYVGAEMPADAALHPLDADLSGFPPLLVQVGSIEILLDDATRIAARAAAADVPTRLEVFPGLPHVFQSFAALLPDAARALQESAAFIRSSLAAGLAESGKD
jgi:acetyl esterase/lipase